MLKYIKLCTFIIISMYCANTTAQTNPFSYFSRSIYEFDYVPDSTQIDKRRKEIMVLFTNRDTSLFLSYNTFAKDSLTYEYNKINKKLSFAESMNYQTPIQYSILKKHHSDTIQTFDYIGMRAFCYIEPKSAMAWQIDNDSMTIEGISCRKADCYFGGRHWTAWFAPSIPISDGPYKFYGLPGLILQMNDNNDYFKFTIRSLVNVEGQINLSFPKPSMMETVPKQKFLEKHHQYAQDPMPFMMNNNSSGGGKIIFKDKEGAIRMGKAMQKVDTPIEW